MGRRISGLMVLALLVGAMILGNQGRSITYYACRMMATTLAHPCCAEREVAASQAAEQVRETSLAPVPCCQANQIDMAAIPASSQRSERETGNRAPVPTMARALAAPHSLALTTRTRDRLPDRHLSPRPSPFARTTRMLL